jgi:hypothetical protein
MPMTGRSIPYLVSLAAALFALGGCASSNKPEDGRNQPVDIPAIDDEYVVFAWNDLGMHCLNPNYDEAVLLPPYNTVWAQVVKRGNPPQIITEGLTAEYRIVDNTYSYGKTDDYGGAFAGFWENSLALFGVALERDTGLNLDIPTLHNGLSGQMVAKAGPPRHFQVNGIPVTPVNDSGVWNPYQVIEVTIKSGASVVAQTRATVPTSDEINCGKAGCHAIDRPGVFHNILVAHDNLHGSTLASSKPVLCADCHGSPALGRNAPGSSGRYLSAAIHGAHAPRGAACLDCHPGAITKCNRSLAHAAADGNCVTCHGSMTEIASSIDDGTRVPWVNEPKCVACHTGVSGVDTGTRLYRDAWSHGGISCAACHDSPHAMYPSREASDNYQPLQYQNSSKTIGSCGVCHENSRGGGGEEFGEEHGGPSGKPTACRVCHTRVPTDTTEWPHKYEWKAR